MKLGLALSGPAVNPDNLRFARQAGVTHIVAHLTHYELNRDQLPDYAKGATGYTGPARVWSYPELRDLRDMINAEGLVLEALENFNPAFWSDVLLDGPRKHEQMDSLKQLIRDVGRAGIPIFGYNFSLAGLAGAAMLDEEPERAARLWGAAEALRQSIGARHAPAARVTRERLMAAVREQLGEEAFGAAWAKGQAMTMEQAVAEATRDR